MRSNLGSHVTQKFLNNFVKLTASFKKI